MGDAGFYRGTSSEQDSRFGDKQKKLLGSMRFEDVLKTKVDVGKVNMDIMKPWITQRVNEILGMEDDVVVEFVFTQLEEKNLDPRVMQINLTGFLNAKRAREFVGELWQMLVDGQNTDDGIPPALIKMKMDMLKKRMDEGANARRAVDRVNRNFERDDRGRGSRDSGAAGGANANMEPLRQRSPVHRGADGYNPFPPPIIRTFEQPARWMKKEYKDKAHRRTEEETERRRIEREARRAKEREKEKEKEKEKASTDKHKSHKHEKSRRRDREEEKPAVKPSRRRFTEDPSKDTDVKKERASSPAPARRARRQFTEKAGDAADKTSPKPPTKRKRSPHTPPSPSAAEPVAKGVHSASSEDSDSSTDSDSDHDPLSTLPKQEPAHTDSGTESDNQHTDTVPKSDKRLLSTSNNDGRGHPKISVTVKNDRLDKEKTEPKPELPDKKQDKRQIRKRADSSESEESDRERDRQRDRRDRHRQSDSRRDDRGRDRDRDRERDRDNRDDRRDRDNRDDRRDRDRERDNRGDRRDRDRDREDRHKKDSKSSRKRRDSHSTDSDSSQDKKPKISRKPDFEEELREMALKSLKQKRTKSP